MCEILNYSKNFTIIISSGLNLLFKLSSFNYVNFQNACIYNYVDNTKQQVRMYILKKHYFTCCKTHWLRIIEKTWHLISRRIKKCY